MLRNKLFNTYVSLSLSAVAVFGLVVGVLGGSDGGGIIGIG